MIARDRANLQQGLHAVTHELAQNLRSLDRAWAQYKLAQETREAAWSNLNLQIENFRVGRARAGETPFVNVRLAIADWGNAISSEAQYLTLYNIELANLERQTGTILETHGIRFYEERFCTLGPLGELGRGRMFPSSLEPGENVPRYPHSQQPAEESFNLENPDRTTGPHATASRSRFRRRLGKPCRRRLRRTDRPRHRQRFASRLRRSRPCANAVSSS